VTATTDATSEGGVELYEIPVLDARGILALALLLAAAAMLALRR
jgi:hypothetical protein